ncbi:MAG: TIGR03618 family F420-dependent PPOX class oxidoreductase [Anaerolineae bacterium]|nr:TIGR03618 family F420-dependent PPOX class oxidoreductase [Anaerolineae bacterium]
MPGHIPFRKIDLWLQGFRSIWISTTRPDGRPHAVPVWYWWDGRNIYFMTSQNSQKARNLALQPAIVVHAGDGDDTIILEGTAAVVTDADELRRVNEQFSQKYVDPNSGARATIYEPGAVVYRVNVRRMMVWEYGNVGSRTDWNFESPAAIGTEER